MVHSGGHAHTVRTFVLLQGGPGEQGGLQVQLAESKVACQGEVPEVPESGASGLQGDM